jgi:hypothetical protein
VIASSPFHTRGEKHNSYLYIKAAKSFFNIPREKLSPRPLAAEADNLEDIKGFRGEGVLVSTYQL